MTATLTPVSDGTGNPIIHEQSASKTQVYFPNKTIETAKKTNRVNFTVKMARDIKANFQRKIREEGQRDCDVTEALAVAYYEGKSIQRGNGDSFYITLHVNRFVKRKRNNTFESYEGLVCPRTQKTIEKNHCKRFCRYGFSEAYPLNKLLPTCEKMTNF